MSVTGTLYHEQSTDTRLPVKFILPRALITQPVEQLETSQRGLRHTRLFSRKPVGGADTILHMTPDLEDLRAVRRRVFDSIAQHALVHRIVHLPLHR